MDRFHQILLIFHFIGLAMGFSASFSNIVMGRLIAVAPGPEKAVLGRFPLAISRVGTIGLGLLWVTGLTMLYTRWNGFAAMPWQFHVKIGCVVLLSIVVGYIHLLQGRLRRGDAAVAARIEPVGKLAFLFALTALVFAVLTFA